jgi:YggT family protein
MAVALLNFLFIVLHLLLQAVIWLIVANAIMSWLVAFDVINMRNRFANQAVRFLDSVTRPLLRPFRRIIPPLGGIDITPVILIIIIEAADQALLPALYSWLVRLVA